jgi:hypothetical protein
MILKLQRIGKSVRLGARNRWFDVYPKLDPLGLTVLGGRVSIVGVGGFLLGGESLAELGVE